MSKGIGNIVYISPYAPDEDGLATYMVRLLSALKRHRGDQNFSVLRWGFSRWRSRLVAPIGFVMGYLKRCLDADIVHVQFIASRYLWHLIPVFVLRKIFDKPTVVTLHEQDDNSKFPRFFQMLTRLYVSLASQVIVHTHEHKQWLPCRFEQKITVIPHLVPIVPVHESESTTDVTYQLLQIGFIAPWKGYETSLYAIHRLVEEGYDVELQIMGKPYDVSYLERLRTLAVSLGIVEQVVFTTRFVTDTEYWKALRDAFVVLLPYRRSTMSGILSNVLAVEGVPVMSDLRVFREYTHDSGIYVSLENADALVSSIRRLINFPEVYESQRILSRKLKELYGADTIAEQTLALYDEII